MEPSYLSYLAKTGATNIHPLGEVATACLIAVLNPRPGERLLELGCGTGETMARLVLQAGVRVDGFERLPPMLQMSARRLKLTGALARTALVCATGTALPVAKASYDAVYTESVLGYQPPTAARAILREIRRVLKPGGRYLANEAIWKQGTDPEIVAAIHRAGVADFGLSQASPQPWSVENWLALMKESGFQVEAAELLPEMVGALTAPPRQGVSRQLQRSAILTAYYRLRSFFVPHLLRQKWQFRRRLARHATDGRYLESRLFRLRVQ